MDRVVLDTDILSEVLKRKDPTVVVRAEEYLRGHGRFTITSVTVLEIVAGWHRLQREDRVQQFLARVPDFEVLPIDTAAAVQAGRIEADLARTGRTVGRADSMIAAVAATRGLQLVTGNAEHYARIANLGVPIVLANWRQI
ncbi:MAG: type II toxin-antitoxin system VapC family toxin [Myxococcales bacterium]|nr:type II toxin-antitoxin system VapC family toxin [Myxococcales bacterium]